MPRRGDHIHKRKDGRWEGRYKDGCKPDGTVKYSSVYADTYCKCKEKLNYAVFLKKEHKAEKDVVFSKLLNMWMNYNQIRLKGSTKNKYAEIIEKHLLPELGAIKITSINSTLINAFLNEKIAHGGIRSNSALSPSYVRTMAIIIESALNFGVCEGICEKFKTPINKPNINKISVNVLDKKAEENIILSIIKSNSAEAIGILLALQAGLRIGEVCALRWSDLDFNNNMIFVNHTVSRVRCEMNERKTQLILDTPKSNASKRTVPMTALIREKLLEYKSISKSEFVVSNTFSFVSPRTFDYRYKSFLYKNQLEKINFHAFRHTYATRCAEAGIDAKTLSLLLGHSTSLTSLSVYVHPSLDTAKKQLSSIFDVM